MDPIYLSIVGLIIDMFGVYFLAIEVIGIERLRILRGTRFRTIDRSEQSKGVFSDVQTDISPTNEAQDGVNNPGCIIATGVLGAIILGVVLFSLSASGFNIFEMLLSTIGNIYVLTAFIILFLSIPFFVLISIIIGMAIYKIVITILNAPISFIEYTERRYAGGTAGLLGFLLIVIGLMLQLLSTVLQQRARVGG